MKYAEFKKANDNYKNHYGIMADRNMKFHIERVDFENEVVYLDSGVIPPIAHLVRSVLDGKYCVSNPSAIKRWKYFEDTKEVNEPKIKWMKDTIEGAYSWKHGFNDTQEFYEVKLPNGDYLYTIRQLKGPCTDTWTGGILWNDGRGQCIYDRTANNKQRKKEGVDLSTPTWKLHATRLLGTKDPHKIIPKIEYCYKNKKIEVTP